MPSVASAALAAGGLQTAQKVIIGLLCVLSALCITYPPFVQCPGPAPPKVDAGIIGSVRAVVEDTGSRGWLSAKASPFESRKAGSWRNHPQRDPPRYRQVGSQWRALQAKPAVPDHPPAGSKKSRVVRLADPGLSRKLIKEERIGIPSRCSKVESARNKEEDLRNTVHVAGNSLGTAGQLWRRTAGHASAQANKCRGSEADS